MVLSCQGGWTMVLKAHAVPWWISHSCDIEAKNEFGDGEWTPAWVLEGCSHISDFLMGMIRYLLHSPACVKFKALCLVWYIKIMLHTMAKLLCSHSTLFTDTASSSWRVWDTTPTQKNCAFQRDDHWGQEPVAYRLYRACRRDKKKDHSHCLDDFNSFRNSPTGSFCKPQWIPKYFKLYA